MKNNDVSVPPKWDNRACDSLGDIIHQQWNPPSDFKCKSSKIEVKKKKKKKKNNFCHARHVFDS